MSELILEPVDKNNYVSVVNTDYALLAKDAIDESTSSDNWLVQKPTNNTIFGDNKVPTDVIFEVIKGKEFVRLEDAYLKVKWKIKDRTTGNAIAPDTATLSDCAWRLFRRVNLQLGLNEIQNVNHVDELAPINMLMDMSCEEVNTLSDMYWFYAGQKNAGKLSAEALEEFALDADAVTGRNPDFNPSLARRMERHNRVTGDSTGYITSILPLKYVLSSLEALPMIRSNEIKLSLTVNDKINELIEYVGELPVPGLFVHISECDLYYRCLIPSIAVETKLAESYLNGEIGHKFFMNTVTAFSQSHQPGQSTFDVRLGTFRNRLEGLTFVMKYRDRINDMTKNYTAYDHCGLRTFRVSAGGRSFPVFPVRTSFPDGDITEAYLSLLTKIRNNNMRIDELSMVTWDGFASGDYTICYVDLSKYSYEGPDIDVKDLTLHIEFDPEDGRGGVDIFSIVEYYQELIVNVSDGKTIVQKTTT